MMTSRDKKKTMSRSGLEAKNHNGDPRFDPLAPVSSRKFKAPNNIANQLLESGPSLSSSALIVANASAVASSVMSAAEGAPQPNALSLSDEGQENNLPPTVVAPTASATHSVASVATTATTFNVNDSQSVSSISMSATINKSDSKSISSVTTSTTGAHKQRISLLTEIPAIIADSKTNQLSNEMIHARLAAALANDGDLNITSPGVTADFPLKLAVNSECPLAVLEWLLDMKQHPKHTVDVNLIHGGVTALMVAVAYEDPHLYSDVTSTQDSKTDQRILNNRKRVKLLIQTGAAVSKLLNDTVMAAVRSGNLNYIDRFFKKSYSNSWEFFNNLGLDLYAMLCGALECGYDQMVSCILQQKNDWRLSDDILSAVMKRKNKIPAIKMLIAANINMAVVDNHHGSSLMQVLIAYKKNQITLPEAKAIIECIQNDTKKDGKIQVFFNIADLFYAIDQGWLDIVKMLVDDHKVDVNQALGNVVSFGKYRWGSDHRPLRMAGFKGNIEIVKFLTLRGAAVNRKPQYPIVGPWFSEALMDAIHKGDSHIETVKYLISRDAILHPDENRYKDYLGVNRVGNYLLAINWLTKCNLTEAKKIISKMDARDRNDLLNLYDRLGSYATFVAECRKGFGIVDAKGHPSAVVPPPATSPNFNRSNEGQSSAAIMQALPVASAPVFVPSQSANSNDNKNDLMSRVSPSNNDAKSIAVVTRAVNHTPAHFRSNQPAPVVPLNITNQIAHDELTKITGMLDNLLCHSQIDEVRLHILKIREEVVKAQQKIDDVNKSLDASPA